MRLLQPEDAEYKACAAIFGPEWAEKWLPIIPWLGEDDKALDLMGLVRDDDRDGGFYEGFLSARSRWARDVLEGWKSVVETRQPASAAGRYFGQTARKSAEGNPYFGNEARKQQQEYQARQEANARKVGDAIAGMFRGE